MMISSSKRRLMNSMTEEDPPSMTFVRSSLVFPYPSSALIGKKKFRQRRILGLPSQQFLSISLLGGLGSILVWDVIELLVSAPISSTLRCFRTAGCDQFLPSSFFSDPLTVCDWCCWCARVHCGALFWFEVGCLGSLVSWWSYYGRVGGTVGAVLLGGFLARSCLPRLVAWCSALIAFGGLGVFSTGY
ncbi:hypothetical protein ACOSQ2_028681 [Xanthoceras sorbifolium]